ncbi:pseudouridine synthase [Taibaiella koreensis]|uniref:pseudouridine synthase n=1 Tax=Taibaiella koreensis TaxID=1268548 RepID=UPI000E59CAB4|nr:pseudouridine synthase [Taibaiella koreensis]
MPDTGLRYFMIHKPYNMVSQFVSPDKVRLLGALDFDFPEGTHAIGRLDGHSEGLLLLTTDKRITRLLFESEQPHRRSYLVQVRRVVTPEKLEQLRNGVSIRIGEADYYTAKPKAVTLAAKPEYLPELQPHYREVPHSWLLLTLTEGKFHQVRKMVAAIGHPCKRLIRVSIEDLELGELLPGQVRELDQATFFGKLKLVLPPEG